MHPSDEYQVCAAGLTPTYAGAANTFAPARVPGSAKKDRESANSPAFSERERRDDIRL